MEGCPLKPERSTVGKKCYSEGILLLEPFIPKMDLVDKRVLDLISGMKETNANQGLSFSTGISLDQSIDHSNNKRISIDWSSNAFSIPFSMPL